MTHVFCTDLSRAMNDPLPGSGTHPSHHLLISWPRAKWQRNLRHASDMPDALVARLDDLAANGRRVNLIHRRDMASRHHEVILMPERKRLCLPRTSLIRLAESLLAGEEDNGWPWCRQHNDLVLCCTHGKKDKCCARYGYRSYKSLTRIVSEHGLPFDVWESSHLGGCRFAASVVLLSPVRKYGRIEPAQALPMLLAEARGKRFLPGYRGASHLTAAQQCAEVTALQWLAGDSDSCNVQLQLLGDCPAHATGSTSSRHRRLHWRWQRRYPVNCVVELGVGRKEDLDDDNISDALQAQDSGELIVICHTDSLNRIDMCSDIPEGPSNSQIWQASEVLPISSRQ